MKIKLIIVSIVVAFMSMPVIANASSLPKSLTAHKWYQTTDLSQGGYHDKTYFSKNSMKTYGYDFRKSPIAKGWKVYKFSNIKKYNKNMYAVDSRLSPSKKKYKMLLTIKGDQVWFATRTKEHINGQYGYAGPTSHETFVLAK
ncbi:hypothetical protein [Nicoliella lavandulae]|uniref:Uncharacterized protein n=1 Tax=Nicoliella lavandulae TaxID=3082954 RepID=A0ABU8SLP8_9LACO